MPAQNTTWWPGPVKAAPDFNNLLKVLRREAPERPTLFEFFLNGPLYRRLAGEEAEGLAAMPHGELRIRILAFRNAGYDYATVNVPGFSFPVREQERRQTISQNEGFMIADRKTFDAYAWPDPEQACYGALDELAAGLPSGMKLVVCGPGGVLENAVSVMGYERMCYMAADDRRLVEDVFEAIGSRLARFYARAARHPAVGAIIGNDDWGFKSQTMLSPDDMRRFVFPWHRQIAAAAHQAGKPAILHSCGNIAAVMDDVIDVMRYDGKHSFEDIIQPVEAAYVQHGGRIAILGGIDLDFVVRSSPGAIYRRSKAMLKMAEGRGAFALGTGNSVPEYVPHENYFAMIAAALESRRHT